VQNTSAQTPSPELSGTWHGAPNSPSERRVQKITFNGNQLAYEIDEGASFPYKNEMQIVKIIPQTKKSYGVIFVKFKENEYDEQGTFTCFLYRNKSENQVELTNFFPGLIYAMKRETIAELEDEIENPSNGKSLLEIIAEMGWQTFLSPTDYQKMLALPDFPLNDKNAYLKVRKAMIQEIQKLMAQFPRKENEIDYEYTNQIMQKLNFCQLMVAQGYNCGEKSMTQLNSTTNFLSEKNDPEFIKLDKDFRKLFGNE
jgi:hypothetical protein